MAEYVKEIWEKVKNYFTKEQWIVVALVFLLGLLI